MEDSVLAMDLGATWLRLAYVSPTSSRALRRPTPAAEGLPAFLEEWSGHLWKTLPAPIRVGVSRAPALDRQGRVSDWPSRRDWLGAPLLGVLRQWSNSIFHEDDGTCAALWEEQDLGGGRGRTLCLSVGSGLGTGLVEDGRALPSEGGSRTLGHLPLGIRGRQCACGRRGCLQATLCAPALKDAIRKSRCAQTADCFSRAMEWLRSRHAVDEIVLSGGGAELLKQVLQEAGSRVEVRFSRTPNASALAGAALLAARSRSGPGADFEWPKAIGAIAVEHEQAVAGRAAG